MHINKNALVLIGVVGQRTTDLVLSHAIQAGRQLVRRRAVEKKLHAGVDHKVARVLLHCWHGSAKREQTYTRRAEPKRSQRTLVQQAQLFAFNYVGHALHVKLDVVQHSQKRFLAAMCQRWARVGVAHCTLSVGILATGTPSNVT